MNYFVIPGIVKPDSKPKSLVFYSEKRILEAVLRYFNVDKAYLCIKSKATDICFKRQITMYFLAKHTNYTYRAIARIFRLTDHSTVICGIKTVNDEMDTDERVKNMIKEIEENI